MAVHYFQHRPGKPRMATPCLITDLTTWIERLARLLDRCISWRLLPILTGLLFATGRRTESSWLRAGELSPDYQDYYYFLAALGRNAMALTAALLAIALSHRGQKCSTLFFKMSRSRSMRCNSGCNSRTRSSSEVATGPVRSGSSRFERTRGWRGRAPNVQ